MCYARLLSFTLLVGGTPLLAPTLDAQVRRDRPPSGGATLQPIDAPPRVQPMNFKAELVGPGTVKLTWDPPRGASSYWLVRNGGPVTRSRIPGTVHTDQLTEAGTYTYRVVAYYPVGGGAEVEGDMTTVPSAAVTLTTRVCMASTNDGALPGGKQSLDELVANPPDPTRTWVMAWYWPPGENADDTFKIEIETAPGLTKDEVIVGLATRVDWAKEIVAWNACTGAVSRLHQAINGALPVEMRVRRIDAHTLVFRKPKLFGVWTDIIHLNTEQFWNVFGGKKVTFTWMRDRA